MQLDMSQIGEADLGNAEISFESAATSNRYRVGFEIASNLGI